MDSAGAVAQDARELTRYRLVMAVTRSLGVVWENPLRLLGFGRGMMV